MINKLVNVFDIHIMSSKIAIAVSGGLDSIVLMNLAKLSNKIDTKSIHILIVDHGLRKNSKDEAFFAKQEAGKLGFKSKILTWKGKKPTTKIQETARNSRYDLLFDYCRKNDISDLFIAHHLDDQIENFIFRMFRGSGIKGLTSFSNIYKIDDINIIRPLIEIPKSDLLIFAEEQKLKWIEDISNSNLAFDRVKIRNALNSFYKNGFDKKLFLKSINKLKSINEDLDFIADDYVKKYIKFNDNIFVSIDKNFFFVAPKEIQMRVIKNCISFFAPEKPYPPKDTKIINLMKWIKNNQESSSKTLGGTLFKKNKKVIILYKEVNNLTNIKPIMISKSKYKCWDNRFLIKSNVEINGKISYLGPEGVKILKSKKIDIKKTKKDAPIAAIYSSPAIWEKKCLISAPIFDYCNNDRVNIEIKKIGYML